MPFIRPTLPEVVDRVQSDFVSRLSLSGALLRRSVVRVLARVLAGAAHMLHGHLDFLSRQIFADTAESSYLTRIGGLFGITVNAAEFSTGEFEVTGTNGAIIPADTVLLRSDSTEYTVDSEVTIAGGVGTLQITASVAAADGDCDSGVSLTFESPIAGVDSTGTVGSDGLSGGADSEDQEDYRTRVVERMQAPPHGGATADYVAWAKAIAGVTRVWVYRHELGIGTVVVRFVRDDDASPIPDSGEVAAVNAYLQTVKPVTATVTVSAPVAAPVAFTIALTPNTTPVQAAVTAELTDLLRRVAEPGSTLLLSSIRTAIGTAAGVTNYVLTVPAADVTHTTGQLATIGTVTYV